LTVCQVTGHLLLRVVRDEFYGMHVTQFRLLFSFVFFPLDSLKPLSSSIMDQVFVAWRMGDFDASLEWWASAPFGGFFCFLLQIPYTYYTRPRNRTLLISALVGARDGCDNGLREA
jgi:hypothetical protein